MLNKVFPGLWMLVPLCGLAQVPAPVKPLPAKAHVHKVAVVELPPLTDLSLEQLAVAEKVLVGVIPCELSTTVSLSPHAQSAGRFVLTLGRQQHVLEPVPTSTGAVRLEDPASGMVWIQLANKSMLMNQKLGKRLADECMTSQQRLVADALLRSPAPNLLEPIAVAKSAESPAPQPPAVASVVAEATK